VAVCADKLFDALAENSARALTAASNILAIATSVFDRRNQQLERTHAADVDECGYPDASGETPTQVESFLVFSC
jgi:hypothetical protein